MRHTLSCIIHAFTEADENTKNIMEKFDIKDRFWCLDCEEGKEWNFCYVLLEPANEPVQLVVSTSLQMGWMEFTPYFLHSI